MRHAYVPVEGPCLGCGRAHRVLPSEICPACVGAPAEHPFEVWTLFDTHGAVWTRRYTSTLTRAEALTAARRVSVYRACLGVAVGFFRRPVWTEEHLFSHVARRLHYAIEAHGLEAPHGERSTRGKPASCRLCGARTVARLRDARGRPICELCVRVCAWCGKASVPGCIDEDGSPTCEGCSDAAATATHLLRACPRPEPSDYTGERSVVAMALG